MVTTCAFFPPSIPTLCCSFRSQPSFPLSATLPPLPSKRTFKIFTHPSLAIPQTTTKLRRIRAAPQDVVPPETTLVETASEVVSAADDGVSTAISVLLFVAFAGLSILTLGVKLVGFTLSFPLDCPIVILGCGLFVQVIYLGVTDFLQKREKEKFEKEQAANSGKKKKKKKLGARAGPKGFGQKIEDEDEDDE